MTTMTTANLPPARRPWQLPGRDTVEDILDLGLRPDLPGAPRDDRPALAVVAAATPHGGCFGEEGHCEVRGPATALDRRPPHQLAPATRVLVVTDAVRRAIGRGSRTVQVTAVAEVRPSALADPGAAADVLVVDQVALHTYR